MTSQRAIVGALVCFVPLVAATALLFVSPRSPISLGFEGCRVYDQNGFCATFKITNSSRYVYHGHSHTSGLVTDGAMAGWTWDMSARSVETIWIPMHRTDVAWQLRLDFARERILLARRWQQPRARWENSRRSFG